MKRFLCIMMLLIATLAVTAETQWYNARSYAFKQVNSYGYWTDWTPWKACNISIKFDLDTDWITIYSNKTQYYKVVKYHGDNREYDGSYQYYFTANDSNGGVCTIRLRVETNGNSQIYIVYNNAMWVYNVVRSQ